MGEKKECRDADISICVPRRPTEFEIMAELYDRLRTMCRIVDSRMEVKSEVTVTCDGRPSRYDLMIVFWHDEARTDYDLLCGIEVKKNKWSNTIPQSQRQRIGYEQIMRVFGLPIVYCIGLGSVQRTVDTVRRIIE